MEKEQILDELKEWLKNGIVVCNRLALEIEPGTEKTRLSEKTNTLQMVLGKIKEFERE